MTHADILDSDHGSELLAFLLLAPMRSYSAKELAGRLQITEKILSSLLQEFLDDSMIKQLIRDGSKLYIINKRHKLLPEIRTSLAKNHKPYEDEFLLTIAKLGEVKAAFLSGALTGNPELPVDLLIVGKVTPLKLDTFLKQCKMTFGFDLNYSVMTPEEFQLRRDTFDRFLKDVFDYPHLVVVDKLTKAQKGIKS